MFVCMYVLVSKMAYIWLYSKEHWQVHPSYLTLQYAHKPRTTKHPHSVLHSSV